MTDSSHIPVIRIALVGDYSPEITAHQAIPLALDDAAAVNDVLAQYEWLATDALHHDEQLAEFDAIWVVPGSPYRSEAGAIRAVRYARENAVPFLGTCGGFQHAIVEYARNVLGREDATHGETASEGWTVIAPLACSLVEAQDTIELRQGTAIARAYGKAEISEKYHCNYGVSPLFSEQLTHQPLKVTGWDEQGEIRAVELTTHPFFVATLFQHERHALEGRPSPLVQAFVRVAAR
ncbi:CTP synthase [Shimwellia pseudoproteus]|uniref:CTP synthase C-terminal region-related (seleno)protein n=1 Tax=Shimwellia pseudoproteus TaxID=570012 RepID=UPI0018EE1536|nr:CTP synthase [Shimwellia pseudoproteus]MBJ3813930.1 CTP synthase [Shimwellia pseudoproteus]